MDDNKKMQTGSGYPWQLIQQASDDICALLAARGLSVNEGLTAIDHARSLISDYAKCAQRSTTLGEVKGVSVKTDIASATVCDIYGMCERSFHAETPLLYM